MSPECIGFPAYENCKVSLNPIENEMTIIAVIGRARLPATQNVRNIAQDMNVTVGIVYENLLRQAVLLKHLSRHQTFPFQDATLGFGALKPHYSSYDTDWGVGQYVKTPPPIIPIKRLVRCGRVARPRRLS